MQRYRANTEKVVWRIVDGEAVIVHAETSAYYGLNATATCIWETLASASVTREDIGRRMSVRYGAAADPLFADIDAFLIAAGKEDLVVHGPPSNANPTEEPGTRETPRPEGRYEPPILNRFGELEKLVLSGE